MHHGGNCSAAAHASVSGNVHFVAEDDADAVRIVRRLLSYVPANNLLDPPHEHRSRTWNWARIPR